MTSTEKLAEQITTLRYEDLDAAVADKLKTCLLYGLSMAAAGTTRIDAAEPLESVFASTGKAQTLISGKLCSAPDAVFLNAHLMCARGQNDTFSKAFAHPGCVIIPAILAVAQECGASGQEVLTAMAAGYETLARCSVDIAPAVVERQFRASSVFGVLGVAAATSKLLGLNQDQTAHAIGLATQFAGGTMQCWTEGTPEWRIQIAHCSRSGVLAALLAKSGQTAARESLEGAQGFYSAFSGTNFTPKEEWLWETPNVVFKPMPGCLINQPATYLLMKLQRRHALKSSDVRRVQVALSRRNAAYPGIASYGPFPTATGAIMSCPFMVETMLRNGMIKATDFHSEYAASPIHASSRRVTVTESDELSDWGCRLVVELQDGTVLTDEMLDLTQFCFDWEECNQLLLHVAEEWPLENAANRFQELSSSIAQFEGAPSVQELMKALTAS